MKSLFLVFLIYIYPGTILTLLEKTRMIEKLAKNLTEEKTLIIWHSKKQGEILDSQKTYTEKIYDYLKGWGQKISPVDQSGALNNEVIKDYTYEDSIRFAKNVTIDNGPDYLNYLNKAIMQSDGVPPEVIKMLREYESKHKGDPKYYEVLTNALKKAKSKEQYLEILPKLENVATKTYTYPGEYSLHPVHSGFSKKARQNLMNVFDETKATYFGNGAVSSEDILSIQNKISSIKIQSAANNVDFFHSPNDVGKFIKNLDNPNQFLDYLEAVEKMKNMNIKILAKIVYNSLEHFDGLNPKLDHYARLKGIVGSKNLNYHHKTIKNKLLRTRQEIQTLEVLEQKMAIKNANKVLTYEKAMTIAKTLTIDNGPDYLHYLNKAIIQSDEVPPEVIEMLREYESKHKGGQKYYEVLTNALKKAKSKQQYLKILPKLENVA